MKLSIFFFVIVAALLVLTGQSEGKKFFKRIEKVGKNIRNAAERVLPTAVGYAGLVRGG
ncbi:unnamed protein product [Acanthoscelides obtectus]|uniref:Uncharacterized protein n=1 Tax=Acanthoscelides obtectus TaxID=200917 RepID=A0A9P0JNF6_ACAOB|nr:unnamed protein product [Acanthoscelides obtectus]CAK1678817.1 hypothetical protein AOBTE_LOCUS32031 [Acanthoscelides obtectus]